MIDITPTPSREEPDAEQAEGRLSRGESRVWRSACFQVNKSFVVFLAQFIIALAVLSFSLYKLTGDASCEDTQAYLGLTTMLVGVFIPTPKMSRAAARP
jgi:hypothetical protein